MSHVYEILEEYLTQYGKPFQICVYWNFFRHELNFLLNPRCVLSIRLYFRIPHIVRAVLCRRIIEIFTSNYPGNACVLHSITANFSRPSTPIFRKYATPARGRRSRGELPGDEFRARHLTLAEARDLRA